jgi:hypothetical protein
MIFYVIAIIFSIYAITTNDIYYLALSLIASAIAIILGKD